MNGRPLITYTVDAARQSKLDDFVVSTDCPKIARFGKSIIRPPELAQDETPMLPVIQHAVAVYEMAHGVTVDATATLQPTSPLRLTEDIDKAIELFRCNNYDSLVSVNTGIHPVKSYTEQWEPFLEQTPYDKHKQKCYTRNGAIFLTSRKLLDDGRLFSDRPLLYLMPKSRSVDVDDMDDLLIAESILRKGEIQ